MSGWEKESWVKDDNVKNVLQSILLLSRSEACQLCFCEVLGRVEIE